MPLQTAIAQTAPAKERVVSWAQGNPQNIDPHVSFSGLYTFVIHNMYDALYRYDGNPAEMRPWIATGHTVSPDGLVWTFTLRDDVLFHDGTKMTANDVVYSFQRIQGMKSGIWTTFAPALKIENVVAVDDKTVRFTLDKPFAPFFTAIPTVAIVNSALLKKQEVNGDWAKAWLAGNEAGTGPYMLVPESFKANLSYSMRQFDRHFYGWSDNPKAPTLVHTMSLPEQSTAIMGVMSGSLDVTTQFLMEEDAQRIEKAGGVVQRDQGMRPAVVHINGTRPPMNNVNFRKCLAYAIPYDAIIKELLGGAATRSPTPIPNNMWGNPASPPAYDYDPVKAKEHCDKARAEGAPIDKGITYQAMQANEPTALVAQLLQSELQKIGVPMTITRQLAYNLFSQATKPETTPDLWMSWVSSYYVDPDNFIGQMYDSAFHGTWKASSYYNNPKVDEILRKARLTLDQKEREKLYAEAVKLVHDDAPEIWLFNSMDLRGMTKRVSKGFRYSPVSQGMDLRWLQVED